MKSEKTPQQKIESELVIALQAVLGKPLTRNQAEQVTSLADDLASNNQQALGSLNYGLQSLLEETGLKASTLGPVTALVASYHPIDSSAHGIVGEAIGKFKEVHKVELVEDKANNLNQQIIEAMEGITGRGLKKQEFLIAAELSQSVAYISGKDDVATLTQCLDEVVKNLTREQAQPILDLVSKYHENDPTKQALVSSVVKDVILKKPEVDVALDTMGLVSSDEITQSIRDNVITKQQAYLQGEIAKTMSVEDGVAFNKKTPEEMRAYLGTEEGKAATKEVMKTKEAQSAMNKIEVEGYREVHKIESFKNVGWAQETGTKVRIAEIKNDAGEVVASLKETTVNAAPTQVTLEDGTTRTVKSYRQIDFPKNLEDGKGPAHFSMAVKDENGNNISAKDAVYFTAHYDDAGKLTEVSSPVPVKFMGTGDDAIGYIERNGKVYTLPVTQGKYKEMMQQVAINNGLSVDLGQAVDSVSIPPRTVGPELQEPEMGVILKVEQPTVSLAVEVGNMTVSAPMTLTPIPPPEMGVILKVEQPTVSLAVEVGNVTVSAPMTLTPIPPPEMGVITNLITGGTVSLAVIRRVQEIRQVLDTSSPRTPAVDKGKEALAILKDKTPEQALKAISKAIGDGDDKLVKAMMKVISPPDGKPIEGVPAVGRMALAKVYTDQMESTTGMKLDQDRSKVQRAAGAIAEKAGIVDHEKRVTKPNNSLRVSTITR